MGCGVSKPQKLSEPNQDATQPVGSSVPAQDMLVNARRESVDPDGGLRPPSPSRESRKSSLCLTLNNPDSESEPEEGPDGGNVNNLPRLPANLREDRSKSSPTSPMLPPLQRNGHGRLFADRPPPPLRLPSNTSLTLSHNAVALSPFTDDGRMSPAHGLGRKKAIQQPKPQKVSFVEQDDPVAEARARKDIQSTKPPPSSYLGVDNAGTQQSFGSQSFDTSPSKPFFNFADVPRRMSVFSEGASISPPTSPSQGVQSAMAHKKLRIAILSQRAQEAEQEADEEGGQEAHLVISQCRQSQSPLLNLSHRFLVEPPSDVFSLSFVKTLDLTGNRMTSLSADVGKLKGLTSLILTENYLTELPLSIGHLANLTSLNAARNQLSTLPDCVADLKSLLSVDFSENYFSDFPQCLWALSGLQSINLALNPAIQEFPPAAVLTRFKQVKINLSNHPLLVDAWKQLNNVPTYIIPKPLAHVKVEFSSRAFPDLIIPGLYLGGLRTVSNNRIIEALSITHVLSVGQTGEFILDLPSSIAHRHIAISDTDESDIASVLMTAITFIHCALHPDEPATPGGWPAEPRVLVHCFKGASRSASVVISYIMATRKMSFLEAMAFVHSKHPETCPNQGFQKQLGSWDYQSAGRQLDELVIDGKADEFVSSVTSLDRPQSADPPAQPFILSGSESHEMLETSQSMLSTASTATLQPSSSPNIPSGRGAFTSKSPSPLAPFSPRPLGHVPPLASPPRASPTTSKSPKALDRAVSDGTSPQPVLWRMSSDEPTSLMVDVPRRLLPPASGTGVTPSVMMKSSLSSIASGGSNGSGPNKRNPLQRWSLDTSENYALTLEPSGALQPSTSLPSLPFLPQSSSPPPSQSSPRLLRATLSDTSKVH